MQWSEVEQATTGGEGGNRTWLVDCRVCLQSHLRSVSLCDEINDAELGPRLSTTQWCTGQGFALCIAEQITTEPWLCLQTGKPHREFKVRKKNWIYITTLSYTIRLQYWQSFHLESVSDRNDFLCFCCSSEVGTLVHNKTQLFPQLTSIGVLTCLVLELCWNKGERYLWTENVLILVQSEMFRPPSEDLLSNSLLALSESDITASQLIAMVS